MKTLDPLRKAAFLSRGAAPARYDFITLATGIILAVMPLAARGQGRLCVTIQCPSDLVAECQAPQGAVVTFNVQAETTCGGSVTLTCTPSSGSWFPLGETTVHCVAADDLGHTNTCAFSVTVRDTTAPMLQCPDLILVPCESSGGAVVSYTVTATDNYDADLEVACDPPSGSLFPVGTNTVDCYTSDTSHNSGVCTFPVVVTGGCEDHDCLQIQCPSNIVIDCAGPEGTPVDFTVEAVNPCGRIPTVTCVPPSGSVFPVGITTVLCTATDPSGEAVRCTFTVEVLDHEPPVITCPGNLEVLAQAMDGAIVEWSIAATDLCSADITVRCEPPSGSLFPVGVTRVHCVATDPSGNQGHCGFTVTVIARPFEVELAESSGIQLHWYGPGEPEAVPSLDPSQAWEPVDGPTVTNGAQRTLSYPARDPSRFFRLVSEPLVPPPDTDGDGVPDARDRCPGTLAGLAVDDCGCALLQIVHDPRQVAGPALEELRSLVDALWGQAGGVVTITVVAVEANLEAMEQALGMVEAGMISVVGAPDGVDQFLQGLDGLRAAHADLLDAITVMQRDFVANPPDTGGYGDVTAEQMEIITAQVLADRLQAAIDEAGVTGEALIALQGAVVGRGIVRGVVEEVHDAERWIRLVDGRLIGLVKTRFESSPVAGEEVEIGVQELAGGYSLADSLEVIETGLSFPTDILKAICLHLRIAPVQPFPPYASAPYALHYPQAYEHWGTLWLEEGMRLAVVSYGCEDIGLSPGDATIQHRAKLDLTYMTRYGLTQTVTLATGLRSSDTPVELPGDIRLGVPAVLSVQVLRCLQPTGGGPPTQSEVLTVQSYNLIVRARYAYAAAVYDHTVFDIEDVPNQTDTREARVVSFNRTSAALDEVAQIEFLAMGFRSWAGDQMAYVGLDEPFTIYATDLADTDQTLFAFYQLGVTNSAGLYWPRVTGTHNGGTFHYSCALPRVVRDAVSSCGTAPHTFYRLPFKGGWPIWTMSQANDTTYSHKGRSTFAYDFDAPQGTLIRAARGGIVNRVDESYWLNGQSEPPNRVHITHRDGTEAWYLHMPQNGVLVSEGQRVYRGDVIARVGHTGWSTTPHLHLEVRDVTNWSIPIRFEAWGVCGPVIPYPCQPWQECYDPETGDILFSTNQGWWE